MLFLFHCSVKGLSFDWPPPSRNAIKQADGQNPHQLHKCRSSQREPNDAVAPFQPPHDQAGDAVELAARPGGQVFQPHIQQLARLLGVELVQLDGQENGAPSSTKQSADLEAVILRCLAKERDDRPASPADLDAALTEALAVSPSVRAAADEVATLLDLPRREVYQRALALKDQKP